MALSIKNGDTEALARELASSTGETLTEAIRRSLEERLQRVRRGAARARTTSSQVDEICRAYRTLPLADPRPADEILGYDEVGLP